MKDRIQLLLDTLRLYAPDAKAKIIIDDSYQIMRINDETDHYIERRLAQYIVDGLDTGYWPWTIN